jgi:bifunctional UDP-N-acetylglucosamine pyrophosphorylase/glucosamine-1-phosphate N-acetyltransferase
MDHLVVTILAGGEGKRMRSEIPKVLHIFKEKPMLARIIETARECNPKKIIIITGKFHQLIIQTLAKYIDIFGLIFVRQPEPLGTGDAIKCCLEEYDMEDKVLILNGDTPLITSRILQDFIQGSRGSCNVLTAQVENPFGYGRILYDKDGDFNGIVEEKDCSEIQQTINIINGGIYYIHGFILKQFVPLISNNNVQKEYYLTDIVKTVKDKSWNVVHTVLLDESDTRYILGVNTPEELKTLIQL